jgi:hypothetical protein
MPDNVSVLELLIESGATGGTATTEVPFAADIADVTVVAPANVTTAALTLALTRNGTDILAATPLGTVAALGKTANSAGSGMTASSTTLYMEFTGNGQPDIQVGAVLTIGSEQVLVTGQVGGSSQVDGPIPVYAIPVTRGYNSTTAAVHAAGVAINGTPPTIPIGSKQSGLGFNPPYGPTPLLAEGDILVATISGGFATQAAGITVVLELVQR